MKKKGMVLVLLSLGFVLFASPVKAGPSDVAGQLICQCGCTLVLDNCTHVECGSREAMTALIAERLDGGESEGEVVQYFVAQYGEQVLASPVKRGFNLAAWIAPFASLLLGAGVVFVAVKRWTGRGKQPGKAGTEVTSEDDAVYLRRMERELKEFGGGSFR
jgi:cytochrome c-type biogenesis protein CcmH